MLRDCLLRLVFFGKLKHHLPVRILKQHYFSRIHSNFSQLVGTRGSACASILRPLIQVLQNRTFFSYENSEILNILSFYRFGVRQSIDNSNYHTLLLIVFIESTHRYPTRNAQHIHNRSAVKKNCSKRSISFAGPTIYHGLPADIIKTATLLQFLKKKLKTWLHSSQLQ